MASINQARKVFYTICTLILAMIGLISYWRYHINSEKFQSISLWLSENGLSDFEDAFWMEGIVSLDACANLDLDRLHQYIAFSQLDHSKIDRINAAVIRLRERLKFVNWLKRYSLQNYAIKLFDMGVDNVRKVIQLSEAKLNELTSHDVTGQENAKLKLAIQSLVEEIEEMASSIWNGPIVIYALSIAYPVLQYTIIILGISLLFRWRIICTRNLKLVADSIIYVGVYVEALLFRNHNVGTVSDVAKQVSKLNPIKAIKNIRSKFANHFNVTWQWKDPKVVGGTLKFSISQVSLVGQACPITPQTNLEVEMLNPLGNPIGIVSDINENRLLPHIVNISFTLHQAGKYKIHIRVDGNEISNSPFQKEFLAGPADPQQSTIGIASSIIVVTRDVVHSLQLDCRDKFGNYCKAMENRFDLKLTKIGNPSALTNTELALSEQKLEMKVIGEEGAYKAQLLYDSVILKNGDFTLVVLSNVDGAKLHKEIGRKKMNVTFEAKLASKENSYLDFSKKPKKVHCSISARQIKVREYYLKVFSNNVCSFRVLPSTKLTLQEDPSIQEETLVIDDGIQAPLSVVCKEKYLFLATYATFLNRKFVGGDTFAMKMSYFQQELAALNIKRSQSKYAVSISRQHALRDSMKQLKNASTSDWCRPFQIKFQGEQAEDLGGVLREWFHVLSRALFAPSNQLFVGFRDDNQALVRPNNARPPEFAKIKYFEFAGKIVGKCLLESAITRDSNCYIRACFARSFLAQILGLRVHYKHFENDDPEFFTNKIQYILSNDITDLSLVFAEEIYSSDGKLEKIIELKPNGKNCVVNNDNKIEYLDLLAQQRLCKEIQEEKNAFLKGLNDLIPDSLLSIFDENELELLICGTCEYDINDLKLNHAVIGRTSEFEKILSWFWSTIANFTQQEMARLLQFVTGCSQLPPEGFSELSPKFQIVNAMVTGTLPTAHTCFNELCLPIYDSLDDMQHSLLIAINEGSEGFGMS